MSHWLEFVCGPVFDMARMPVPELRKPAVRFSSGKVATPFSSAA
jgi:hypothetical protein